jgi:hypothetical protein
VLRLHKNEKDGIHVTELESTGDGVVIRRGRRGGELATSTESGRTIDQLRDDRRSAVAVLDVLDVAGGLVRHDVTGKRAGPARAIGGDQGRGLRARG